MLQTQEVEPKWRRKPENRPDDILDGALIEFRTKGFKGARIEDIAKHAGLSKGTVYLYFKSKEEMLKALVQRSILPIALKLSEIAEHVCDECTDEPAADVLKKMLLIAGEQMIGEQAGAIPLIIIGESGRFPELAEYYRSEIVEIVMKAVTAVITRGIERNEFRDVNVPVSIRTLMGVIITQVIWNGVFNQNKTNEIPVKVIIEEHLDIFLNGILVSKEVTL
ncbi:TetR/AcrR family transcriptional regulator [Pseudemcibacter aquimaris]|uniref:TetR/AcrR family transcriptional regulator n=1 Tax=Pseudemcibacter aquimaris TaxID=2857064 RepID=UPI002010E734|nr:TetR/AcrR family transcriptional regulator [Pseudemcibacter aquimaris]MCC3860212.1 TetR/AcrR family transcriptional regulator [Pseudemcibacter aquimaris]WDU57537.1 TetR/AcrR family transcriptional regulator [Pseudemcibacter aquimaris]